MGAELLQQMYIQRSGADVYTRPLPAGSTDVYTRVPDPEEARPGQVSSGKT